MSDRTFGALLLSMLGLVMLTGAIAAPGVYKAKAHMEIQCNGPMPESITITADRAGWFELDPMLPFQMCRDLHDKGQQV